MLLRQPSRLFATEHAIVERDQDRRSCFRDRLHGPIRSRVRARPLSADGVRAGSQQTLPAARGIRGHSVSLQSRDSSRVHSACRRPDAPGRAVPPRAGVRSAGTAHGVVTSAPSSASPKGAGRPARPLHGQAWREMAAAMVDAGLARSDGWRPPQPCSGVSIIAQTIKWAVPHRVFYVI